MLFKRLFLVLLMLSTFVYGNSQFEALKTKEKIKVDGQLNEAVWATAPNYSTFNTYYPGFDKVLDKKTIVYLAYGKKHLYFAFKCYEPGKVEAKLRARDTIFKSEDYVGVLLDTYNDKQNAYGFLVNPRGVQGDLMVLKNSSVVPDETKGFIQQSDASQDFVWKSAGKLTDYGYSVEIAIPYETIRYVPGKKVEMGVAFIRQLIGSTQKASSPKLDPEQGALLTQFGKVTYKGLTYNRTYEILPSLVYQNANERDGYQGDFENIASKIDFGVTGKAVLSPTLTLDATYNPDFSQVEADASLIDINLRTANFYSEKRQFFMEGSEKFEIAGEGELSGIQKVVHTRAIIDPIGGVKLTGKLGGKGTFIGLFTADEAPKNLVDNPYDVNAYNGIIRYKRMLSKGSYIGGLYSSRFFNEGYNQIVGIDTKYNLSRRSSFNGNILYSFDKDMEGGETNSAYNIDANYKYATRSYNFEVGVHDIAKNFSLQNGHLNRDGVTSLSMTAGKRYVIKNKFLKMIQPGFAKTYYQYDKYDEQGEYHFRPNINLFMIKNSFVQIFALFGNESYLGKLYRNDGFGWFFMSQPTKVIRFMMSFESVKKPYYVMSSRESSYQGDHIGIFAEVQLNFSSSFYSAFRIIRADFKKESDGSQVYDMNIYRNRTTYQLNKYLFIRATVEYNTMVKYLTTDFLASFTYIPGTVIYAGYGSTYNKEISFDYRTRSMVFGEDLIQMKRSFFFKVSYNYRFK